MIVVITVAIVAVIAAVLVAFRAKPNDDMLQEMVLSRLEIEAMRELSKTDKDEMYVQLSKMTDIAVMAAQMRGLNERDFRRLYLKGAIQTYTTALSIARAPALSSAGRMSNKTDASLV